MKPYIIGDVSSNFLSFKDCLDSIKELAKCGADAAKFQWFTQKDLYGVEGTNQYELKQEWIPDLAQECSQNKIDFLCTVFNPKKVEYINKYVSAHKIASAELTYDDLVFEIADTKKPVILSCGGLKYDLVEHALDLLRNNETKLLYCSAAYPSIEHDLRQITKLLNLFSLKPTRGLSVGYSDHSIDIFTPYVAWKHYGATTIEKHFRLAHIDRTPDSDHSLSPYYFKRMVRLLKGYDEPSDNDCLSEKSFLENARRREENNWYRVKA